MFVITEEGTTADPVKKRAWLLLLLVEENLITVPHGPRKPSYSPFTLSLTKANGATPRYHLDSPCRFTFGGLIPGIIVFAGSEEATSTF